MNILVIDDTRKHLSAAIEQFPGHNVETTTSFYEGMKKLVGGDIGPYGHVSKYSEVKQYEVVFIDLLMPASMCGANPTPEGKSLEGQEMPVGTFLAFLAAKHGAKYVVVYTDASHHDNPCSAMLDVTSVGGRPTVFKVEDADVVIANTGAWMVQNKEDDWVKNWKEALEYLQSRT